MRRSDGTARLQVTETHVYGVAGLPGEASPPRPGVHYHPTEPAPPGPDLVDYGIQDRQARLDLGDTEGLISIAVQAGSGGIGDLYVNIQFEGPSGKPDLCMNGQNELLEQASDWLREILEELSPPGGGWDLRIDAQPCPEATIALKLNQAASILERRLEHSRSVLRYGASDLWRKT